MTSKPKKIKMSTAGGIAMNLVSKMHHNKVEPAKTRTPRLPSQDASVDVNSTSTKASKTSSGLFEGDESHGATRSSENSTQLTDSKVNRDLAEGERSSLFSQSFD